MIILSSAHAYSIFWLNTTSSSKHFWYYIALNPSTTLDTVLWINLMFSESLLVNTSVMWRDIRNIKGNKQSITIFPLYARHLITQPRSTLAFLTEISICSHILSLLPCKTYTSSLNSSYFLCDVNFKHILQYLHREDTQYNLLNHLIELQYFDCV